MSPAGAAPPVAAVVLGTRASPLARAQTERVAASLRAAWPGLVCEARPIVTRGDRTQRSGEPLPAIGGKGLFTAELEQALRAGEIDLAVHSLKDLPTEEAAGIVLGAVCQREDVRDCLVARDGLTLAALPARAVVGTSSLRRAAQLRALRPDLEVRSVRGNVDTRIRKVREGELDAVLLAAAGIHRLGLEDAVTEWLPPEVMLPAPGQGALAVQCREGDEALLALLAAIDDPAARAATAAERGFLRALGAGCTAPVAAYAELAPARLAGVEAAVAEAAVAEAQQAAATADAVAADADEPSDKVSQASDTLSLGGRGRKAEAAQSSQAGPRRQDEPARGDGEPGCDRVQAEGLVRLRALVATPDGRQVVRVEGEGDPGEVGEQLAREALAAGADRILEAARLPLRGRRIAVTRPRRQAAPLAAELARLGAEVAVVPLVRIEPSTGAELDAALRDLAGYDWLVFTSANAVAAVAERLAASPVRSLATFEGRIAAVGPATAAAVRALGVEPAFVPPRFAAEEIAAGLRGLKGARLLLPQSDLASPRLAEALRRRGAVVDAVTAYRTVAVTPSPEELAALARADAIVLASGSAARSLAAALADAGRPPPSALLVCIGPRTAEVAREVGLSVGLVADEASADGLVRAIASRLGESKG